MNLKEHSMADAPLLGARFDQALSLASNLHRGDVRKHTTVPYLSHLLGVTALVLEDGGDEGEAVWDRFSASKAQTVWYYAELARAYRDAGAEGYMIEEFERVVAKVSGRAGAQE
jgi:(p)ppGpp synthase/HD superfamily hydrolase